jgi:hypothetical protein
MPALLACGGQSKIGGIINLYQLRDGDDTVAIIV